MILDKIVKQKKKDLAEVKKRVPIDKVIEKITAISRTANAFKNAIKRKNGMHLIAEVKKASPSAGVIREDFAPVEIAQAYAAAGVDALSVLTEEKFFQGSLTYLEDIAQLISLPVLRKDFLFEEYQIYEAKAAGADAVLLIAAILPVETLRNLLSLSHKLGMDCLVEVHNKDELKKVLSTDAAIIGINNRNLNDFSVRLSTTEELIQVIPDDKIIVSESGIRTNEDARYLYQLRVDAILVGQTLMQSNDIESKIRELISL